MVIRKISFLSVFILLGILFEFCGAQDCCPGDKFSSCINERSRATIDDQPEYKSKVRFGDKVKIFWKGILCGILIVVGGAGYYFFYKKRDGNGFFGFFISKKKSLITIPPKESSASEADDDYYPEPHEKFPKDASLATNSESTVAVYVATNEKFDVHTALKTYTDILVVNNNIIFSDERTAIVKDLQEFSALFFDSNEIEAIQLDAFYANVSC